MKIFKIIYNLSILVIFTVGITKLFRKEYYLGIVWTILVPILMLLPRIIYKKYLVKEYNKNLLNLFEYLALFLLFTSAGLTLFFKKMPIDFDSYSHFANLVVYAIIFGIIYYFIKLKLINKPIRKEEVAIFSLIFNLIFGVFLWELFQKYGDLTFNTNMFFDHYQPIEVDSFLDKLFGAIGTLFGSILIYFKFDDWLNKWKR
jgi:hypothetical protein